MRKHRFISMLHIAVRRRTGFRPYAQEKRVRSFPRRRHQVRKRAS